MICSFFLSLSLKANKKNERLVFFLLPSISSTFCATIFCTKVLCAAFFYLHVIREKLPKRLLYEKGASKMLMNLTPFTSPSLRLIELATYFAWIILAHVGWINCKSGHFEIIYKNIGLHQWFPKSAPRTTSGPQDELKWSANPFSNQYFVLRGSLYYFKWSAHRKSLGTTGLHCLL